MIEDFFRNTVDTPIAPAERCFAITPDDQLELPLATKALSFGSGGDVVLIPVREEAPVTFRNIPAGFILDVRVRAVLATRTTVDDIVGLA